MPLASAVYFALAKRGGALPHRPDFRREEFCDLGRSVARNVRKHVSTRDEPWAQKNRA
jgi:hypothetical protein